MWHKHTEYVTNQGIIDSYHNKKKPTTTKRQNINQTNEHKQRTTLQQQQKQHQQQQTQATPDSGRHLEASGPSERARPTQTALLPN